MQLLAHRIVWAAAILVAAVMLQRRWGELRRALVSMHVLRTLFLTTVLIAANWLTYIWAVLTERVMEASLGYYINPLVTVLLGLLVLEERLSRAQKLAVALACLGVVILVWSQGRLPWIALVLAVTFAFYSLLRKQVPAGPVIGLATETGALAPLALLFLVRSAHDGSGAFGTAELSVDVLLVLSGLITVLPLLLFTYGSRRIALSTVGFLQYLAPSLQFLLAVAVFNEPFASTQLVAFSCIWAALAVFTWDMRESGKSPRHPTLLKESE